MSADSTHRFDDSTAAQQSLGEGLAAAVEGNNPPHLMEANPAAFTSILELQKQSLHSGAVLYHQWRVKSARLDRDPSLVVHLELENLRGSLDDFELFSRALSDAEVHDLYTEGEPRLDP